MNAIKFLILILSASACWNVNAATLSINGQDCGITVNVSGSITAADISKFQEMTTQKFIKKYTKDCVISPVPFFTFVLFSNGGDVDAALQIGRVIRSIDHSTTDARNCASACVFLLAGGYLRTVSTWNGNHGAGLHRFYFSQAAGSDLKEIRSQRELQKSRILAFLREMDISERVLEISESIPPENIKWLTNDEAADLRLDGTDAAYEERETARDARDVGLNIVEYRSRKAQADTKCLSALGTDVMLDCRNAIIYGMSISDWRLSSKKANEKCTALVGSEPSNPTYVNAWAKIFLECRYRNLFPK